MKEVLVIGSGIAGMTAAIMCAEQGMHVTLVSPFPSERSQSVMAAGGINAVIKDNDQGDSVESHIEDTINGGCGIAGRDSVEGLCRGAEDIIGILEKCGAVFTRTPDGKIATRNFGGQSHKRTCYCGTSTGKQIVTALVMETRRFESQGLIERKLWHDFHSALIKDGVCYGALLYDEASRNLEPIYADAVIVATGGQNALFGKTTGSTQCDGYTAGRLFMQGAELKNLEFIQYHPTTIETPQKRMLVSEAARGEGGRLFYINDGERIYFMEDKYGSRGNLMTRDVVSREIYEAGSQVYLDVSFLDSKLIDKRLPEIKDICSKYIGLNISKEPVPVSPSVHFFMGGLAVRDDHQTNIRNLYAVGECASKYHGANRLGGNSLLAAIYSGATAAEAINKAETGEEIIRPDFKDYIDAEVSALEKSMASMSSFPVMYVRDMLAENMNRDLGIVRDEESLDQGIKEIDYYLSICDQIEYDSSVLPYFNYSLKGILVLARAVMTSAKERRESRGAHYRSDFPNTDDTQAYSSIISYDDGKYSVRLDKENAYES